MPRFQAPVRSEVLYSYLQLKNTQTPTFLYRIEMIHDLMLATLIVVGRCLSV
jgi:hypothetical protein